MRVMVVDDFVDLADVLQYQLEKLGHEVTLWTKDFLALLRPGPWENVDVGIVDYSLDADVDGLDILAAVAVVAPHVWRVLHSGYAFEELPPERSWAQAFLGKGQPIGEAFVGRS